MMNMVVNIRGTYSFGFSTVQARPRPIPFWLFLPESSILFPRLAPKLPPRPELFQRPPLIAARAPLL